MILLGDILNLIDENATVYIMTEEEDEPVAVYDGKDSIDPKYNDYKVIYICPYGYNEIDIQIET